MTATEWIAAHTAGTPPALLARVRVVLAEHADVRTSVSEQLLATGRALLAGVIRDSDSGREVALDLLAADACITWAFEASANEPSSLALIADAAIDNITEYAK